MTTTTPSVTHVISENLQYHQPATSIPSVTHVLVFMIDKNAYPLIQGKENNWFSELPADFPLRASINVYNASTNKKHQSIVHYAPVDGDEVLINETLPLLDAFVVDEADIPASSRVLADVFAKVCPDIKFWLQVCKCETFASYKRDEYFDLWRADNQIQSVMNKIVFSRKDVGAALKKLFPFPSVPVFSVASMGGEATAICKKFSALWLEVDKKKIELNVPVVRIFEPKLVYSYLQHLNNLFLEAVDGVNLVTPPRHKV